MQGRLSATKNWIFATLLASLSVAAASAQPYAYVSNVSGNNVSVVDTNSHTKVATISTPLSPSGLAMTSDGSLVYVACLRANSVSVISTASNSVIGNIAVGSTPVRVAITPNGAQVYVVDKGSNDVAVIDTASQSVIATIPVGTSPDAVAFSPDGSRAYVGNLFDGTVSIIGTASRSVLNTFPTGSGTGSGPSGLAVLPNGTVYVSNQYDGTVTVHGSSGNLLTTIGGFVSPNCVAATPNGSRVFVTNGDSKSVSAIDTGSNTLIATITTGTIPTSVAVSADGASAYVTNEFSFTLSQIAVASNTVMNTQSSVGVYPFAVALPPAGGPPPPPQCTFSLSQASVSLTAAGGSGSVNVIAPSGCTWTAASNVGWSQITGGASGSGNGIVSYFASSNGSSVGLSGTLTIAGQTFTINVAPAFTTAAVSAVSVTPSAGGGTSQTFQLQVSDTAGASNLVALEAWFTPTSASPANTCLLYYGAVSHVLYLASDDTSTWSSQTIGAAGTLQNSQCAVNAGGTTATPSGNNLTLSVPITFKPGFAGSKQIFMFAVGSGGNSGWQIMGSWTSSTATVSAASLTPNAGSGTSQTFQFQASDTGGNADLVAVEGWFTPTSSTAANTCLIYYATYTRLLYLASDDLSSWTSQTIGSAGTLQNSQCSVNVGGATATGSGNNLTLSVPITFKAGFAGVKQIFMFGVGTTGNSGWQIMGNWTPSTATVSSVSVTPNVGSGSSQTFQFLASDTGGSADLVSVEGWFTPNGAGTANTCLIYYATYTHLLYLASDSGSSWSSQTIGTTGVLQNSQCSVNVGGATATPSGNNLTLSVPVTFKPAFTGAKQVWMYATGTTGNSGWQNKGTWTVQ